MLISRDDLKPCRLLDLEAMIPKPIESLIIEVMIKKEMWIFICIYNPDKRHKHLCCNAIERIMSEISKKNYKMHFLLGDLNINCLSNESKILTDVTDVYGLKNLIKEPTCFKSKNGTAIDLLFVSNHRRIFQTFNLLCFYIISDNIRSISIIR